MTVSMSIVCGPNCQHAEQRQTSSVPTICVYQTASSVMVLISVRTEVMRLKNFAVRLSFSAHACCYPARVWDSQQVGLLVLGHHGCLFIKVVFCIKVNTVLRYVLNTLHGVRSGIWTHAHMWEPISKSTDWLLDSIVCIKCTNVLVYK